MVKNQKIEILELKRVSAQLMNLLPNAPVQELQVALVLRVFGFSNLEDPGLKPTSSNPSLLEICMTNTEVENSAHCTSTEGMVRQVVAWKTFKRHGSHVEGNAQLDNGEEGGKVLEGSLGFGGLTKKKFTDLKTQFRACVKIQWFRYKIYQVQWWI
ncbi:hypothetical protein CEXT_801171 [Caerostris extrusa]|uniref:Uncharacterized protein n=1 Tax=Caerostris extrusa TaxID=172846 RepID=A0AAV4NDQ9_CAEEX|nr:hypothetical protein CEXT_801171 [Caerostris extrusa]